MINSGHMADTVQSTAFFHTNNNGQIINHLKVLKCKRIVASTMGGWGNSMVLCRTWVGSCRMEWAFWNVYWLCIYKKSPAFRPSFLVRLQRVTCCLGSQFILSVVPRNVKPANIVTVLPLVYLRGKSPHRMYMYSTVRRRCTYVSAMTSAKKRQSLGECIICIIWSMSPH